MTKKIYDNNMRYNVNILLAFFFVFNLYLFEQNLAKAENRQETYKQLNLFGDVFQRVQEQYVEKVTEKKLIEAAISGMLQSLDPHSSYLSPESYKDMQVKTKGKFGGLGIEITMEDGVVKVKELVIEPGKGISYQRHFKRSEIWFVSKGSCLVKHSNSDPEELKEINLATEEVFHVKQGDWHQLINPTNDACHIIEIQYGETTSEEDIERLFYYEKN